MKKQNEKSDEESQLHKRAEELLKKGHFKTRLPTSESDKLKLIHELEVHQIELELQNEELMIANENARLAYERYTDLYDFAPSGYISLSKQGNITNLNFAAAAILGEERSFLMKQLFSSFVSVHTRSKLYLFLEKIYETKVKQSCEIIIALLGNPPKHVNIEGIISQNYKFYNLTLIDITERKLTELKLQEEKAKTEFSEAKFRGIFNKVADAIYSYNPNNMEIIEANEATSAIYGYTHEELIGLSCLAFSGEVEKSKIVAKEVVQKGTSYVNLRHHKKKDGTDIYVQIQVHKIRVKGEEIIFAVCKDITEILKAEKEILDAKEHAEESDRLKSAFLANMSHEIRTPMNGIVGFTNILLDEDCTPEDRSHFLHIIERNSRQLLCLIDDIIDIAKIESNELKICIDKCKVSEMLEDLEDNFNQIKSNLNSYPIELKLEMPSEYNDLVVQTDPIRLRQVVTNLLSNAFKFSDKGTVTYGFNVNEKSIEFFVKDEGIGIPQNKLDEIFERFKQLNFRNISKLKGTGLGLAICKGIIERLGGSISVESEIGVGSRFVFNIPLE